MWKIVLITIFGLLSISNGTGKKIIFSEEQSVYSSCITNENKNGWCRDIQDCRMKINLRNRPKICGFQSDFKTPIVCCPLSVDPVSTNKTGGTITLKRIEAPPISFECGIQGNKNSRLVRQSPCFTLPIPEKHDFIRQNEAISRRTKRFSPARVANFPAPATRTDFERPPPVAAVGGFDAERASWPWMALFGRQRGTDVHYFCDGVLINEQYVLTAAHCLLDPEPFFIRFGEHNFEVSSFSAAPFNVNYENYIIHPKYKLNEGHHDLALIKLIHKITIKDEVRPVCLPWGSPSNIDLLGKCVTVTGWGANRFAGPSTPHLQEVVVNVFDSADCHRSYSTLPDFNSRFPEGLNFENTLCAGDKQGGKDACGGDSGGPLVHWEDRRWVLGGIISQGHGCGLKEFPGLYAPIRNLNYLQWIKDIAFSS